MMYTESIKNTSATALGADEMATKQATTTADFERADRLGAILTEAGVSWDAYEMDGSTVIYRCADMAQARAGLDALTRRGYGIRTKAQKRYGEPSLIVRR